MGGSCQLLFGSDDGKTDRYRPLEVFLKEAAINAMLLNDIAIPLWTKYLFVSPMAGVTSLTGLNFGDVMADGKARTMVQGLMVEVERLARAKGIALPDSVERGIATVERFPRDQIVAAARLREGEAERA